ncbi:MAG: hypothetical protein RBS73_02610 [Prolixibacteraceae bacterium]|jgi:uncharacterized protein involved in exopolysaccharide biosynthesis|nr:hypothetical protein [Prolixibacteraceae bacterium]
MKDIFDNSFVLKVIWKWRIHLAAAGAAAIIFAAVFSSPFFIEPKFKSEGRLYPANIETYSEESESEQMLEILNSYDIKRRMAETFNLAERYKVAPDDPYYRTKILKKYEDHVDCKKTEYESVEIKVLDTEPQVASDMVDSIISFYNQKVYSVRAKRYAELAETYKRDYDLKVAEVDSLNKRMEVLRKNYGLLSYEIQSEQTSMGYMTALADGAPKSSVEEIKKVMDNLSEKGGEFFMMEKEMQGLLIMRDTLRKRYDKALSYSTQKATFSAVVEEPFPADKKSYPVRWLIVFVSLVATEFLALAIVFVLEKLEITKS